MAKFEITRKQNGEFHYNLKASNGEIILSGEGYIAKANCIKGINSVKKNGSNEQRYEKKSHKNGKYSFTIKAKNGKRIGNSDMFESEAARDKAITSMKRNVSSAKIIDLTKL